MTTQTQKLADLLPCPFCGVSLELNADPSDIYVRRYGARYQHPSHTSDCYLIGVEVTPSQGTLWNTRSGILNPPTK